MQPFKDLPPLPNPFAPRAEEEPDFPRWSKEAEMLKSWAHLGLGPKCVPSPKPVTATINHDLTAYLGRLERACDEKDAKIEWFRALLNSTNALLLKHNAEVAEKDTQIRALKLELELRTPSRGTLNNPFQFIPPPLIASPFPLNKPAAETIFVSGVYDQLLAKKMTD